MKLTIRTAAELTAETQAAERARAVLDARRYLAETDWMVVRATETGLPVPDTVLQSRAEARQFLSLR